MKYIYFTYFQIIFTYPNKIDYNVKMEKFENANEYIIKVDSKKYRRSNYDWVDMNISHVNIFKKIFP